MSFSFEQRPQRHAQQQTESEQQKREKEKRAKETLAPEKLKHERLEQEKLERQRRELAQLELERYRLWREELQQKKSEQARVEQERLAQQKASPAEATAREHQVEALHHQLDQLLTDQGYNPPLPPPLLTWREGRKVLSRYQADSLAADQRSALEAFKTTLETRASPAIKFLSQVDATVREPAKVARFAYVLQRIDPAVNHATVSLGAPETSAELRQRMMQFERLAAEQWHADPRRAVMAVHVDRQKGITVLQIGTAQHGPIYITIPKVLRPDELAHRSLSKLVGRLDPVAEAGDPIAIIDGDAQYHPLNFTSLFRKNRVIRAPSGDTSRMASNVATTAERERLATENTTIVNSAPHDPEEYARVFPGGTSWAAWRNEATLWDQTVTTAPGFTPATATREAFLDALTQTENVVVIVAHCDGKSLFMPQPPPTGTQIRDTDIKARQEAITANKPFVYLFACEGGNLANIDNFASVLLDCGASGVVAAQRPISGSVERRLLARVLSEHRKSPPIEDMWQAMKDVDYFAMEVFLA